jgi:hypothetical protein
VVSSSPNTRHTAPPKSARQWQKCGGVWAQLFPLPWKTHRVTIVGNSDWRDDMTVQTLGWKKYHLIIYEQEKKLLAFEHSTPARPVSKALHTLHGFIFTTLRGRCKRIRQRPKVMHLNQSRRLQSKGNQLPQVDGHARLWLWNQQVQSCRECPEKETHCVWLEAVGNVYGFPIYWANHLVHFGISSS